MINLDAPKGPPSMDHFSAMMRYSLRDRCFHRLISLQITPQLTTGIDSTWEFNDNEFG